MKMHVHITCINVLFLFQTIAARLLQSKQTIPHYYLTIDVIVDELLKYGLMIASLHLTSYPS